ncbi:MAG: hypothetical protein HUU38_02655 [Anaerolineales bacterium]|nr:hypothetical protein [Anaerolineales bacterium]
MPRRRTSQRLTLLERYPPSEPCTCPICRHYCTRPGWWTVTEAESALDAGYGPRMMLELAPERTFGVLSPAFRGCEGTFATQPFARNGCTFLKDQRCELFGTGHQPLECRFCHHTRPGLGSQCHADLESDWHTHAGQALVTKWLKQMACL